MEIPIIPQSLYLLLVSSLLSLASAQSVGSFFTAIYLNGVPIGSSQISCSGMGQSSYCCASGQTCEWDDAGKVACCASGETCQGSAYGSSAGAAVGQYYTSSSTWAPQQQTTTIYQSESSNCGCESTTVQSVVPIVPVTVATVETPYTPTTTYVTPTSTYYGYTSTTSAAVAEVTTSNSGCRAYTTVVEANVGTPTRTVGCYIIINSSPTKRVPDITRNGITLLWFMTFMGTISGFM